MSGWALNQDLGGFGGVMTVGVVSLDSWCRWLLQVYVYIVLGGNMGILCAPSVQSCCILSISASYRSFVYGRYRKSILDCV